MTKCIHIVGIDPAYSGARLFAPAVAFCQTHQCVVGSGGCEKARIEELEAALATAQRRFELLACVDDTVRNGVRPSVGAAEISSVLGGTP